MSKHGIVWNLAGKERLQGGYIQVYPSSTQGCVLGVTMASTVGASRPPKRPWSLKFRCDNARLLSQQPDGRMKELCVNEQTGGENFRRGSSMHTTILWWHSALHDAGGNIRSLRKSTARNPFCLFNQSLPRRYLANAHTLKGSSDLRVVRS
ncbi:hypothetical protein BDN67DRAFT_967962 [Paxillus ammoniavirescens]|nr:hypothetical protein BDN67DRAFT_967962 [Paxillus ammoniavirescens]